MSVSRLAAIRQGLPPIAAIPAHAAYVAFTGESRGLRPRRPARSSETAGDSGGEGIHAFAYVLFIGFVNGTYSSIYIASPVVLWLYGGKPGARTADA